MEATIEKKALVSKKPKGETVPRDEFDRLKAAFIKIASMSGHGNQLKEFGYDMWVPKAKDMSKY